MAHIEIYSTQICPYCVQAKSLLKRKGASFEEIDISDSEELRQIMMEKAGGRRTVPQIFINGQHIGGYDDLAALDRRGGLDPLLALK
jgi:glutaredoxin 3